MNNANLIDRYIFDVGRRLPAKNREDVQMELRSALQDALDERGIDPNDKAHEERVVELLREFGEPHKVASGYGTRRFIVGPELQPTYWLVLRIAAFGVIVGQLIRIIVGASQGEALGIGDMVSGFVGGFLTTFAIVSLIFAILEYFLPDLDLPKEEWNPRNLPELTLDRDKIDVFEIVVEIIFTTAFIYVVNAFSGWNLPELVGSVDGGEAIGAQVIDDLITAFQPFIPWITALAVFSIGVRIFLLLRGRWDRWTRWAEVLYYTGSIIVFASLLAVVPNTGVELVDNIVRLSIGISMGICVIAGLFVAWRAARPNDRLPWDGNQLEHDIYTLGKQGERITEAIARKKK